MVTDDIKKAVDGADYILVVTPAFAHKGYAELLNGNVVENQILEILVMHEAHPGVEWG